MMPSDSHDATLSEGGGGDSPIHRFTMVAPGVTFASRYRIEVRLGAGGSGEVYRAFDQLGGVSVALKVLFPRGEESHRPLVRLQRELRILRGLKHPGIVRVHDIGESDGLLYLVMDLLEGETLRARMKRERLPLEDMLRISCDVLEALAAAHAHGVIHRDIKPANIFLTKQRAMLLDFGLARQASDAQLTATNDFLGTPEYIAPEQVKGGRTVGPAADLYSFGIVLWEMLAGAPPFHADSAAEVLIAHLQSDLPPQPADMVRAPMWLRETITAMLEKDPNKRPNSAADVLNRIRSRKRHSLWQRLLLGIRRGKRTRLALFALGMSTVLVAGALLMYLPWRVVADSSQFEIQNLVGSTLPPPAVPFKIVGACPRNPDRVWSQDQLVLFKGTRNEGNPRQSFPGDVAILDLWRSKLRPWPLPNPQVWNGSPAAHFPKFDDFYGGRVLTALPFRNRHGRPLFASILEHVSDYPSVAVIFGEVDGAIAIIPHLGHVASVFPVGSPNEPPSRQLVVFHGESLPLGNRGVLFAVSLSGAPRGSFGNIAVPPYDIPIAATNLRQLAYFSMTSFGPSATVSRIGDQIEISNPSEPSTRYDLRTGVPLDGPERPANPEEWLRNQGDLVSLLRVSSAAVSQADLTKAAQLLEVFAGRDALSASQQGVALARAAFYWRRTGELNRALELCTRARSTEPYVMGHTRMLIDLLARVGRWDDAPRERAMAPSRVGDREEVKRDLLVAGLVTKHIDSVSALLSKTPVDPKVADSWAVSNQAMFLVERGAYSEAADFVDRYPPLMSEGPIAMLGAIAHTLKPRPDVRRAIELLEAAERSKGAGRWLPVFALRRRLARLGSEPGPTDQAIATEAREQQDAGRDDIVDLWWERIGDRIRNNRS